MSTHPRRGIALALVIAGTLAGGVLAGPAMAAGDDGSSGGDVITVRKSGGDQQEYLSMRMAGGDAPSIIGVL
jgi:hypothetical protein